ncbi:tail fiber assembly protein [Shewanella sp. 1180_01]|uniref:tail fiber assembly protein n=1 Tax=Shewanella sp. 1180_01 TaxID=2604451 RepID=UPI00406468B9
MSALNTITDSQLEVIRNRRDLLIVDTDWTQFADSPLSAELKDKYAVYRQALRDMPQQYIDTGTIVWPVKPE